jgi:hypothetical protein
LHTRTLKVEGCGTQNGKRSGCRAKAPGATLKPEAVIPGKNGRDASLRMTTLASLPSAGGRRCGR